ncbi:MAG: DUF4190 domain-containing protein [Clostridiaceae bacterium]|nr:DUF4190 domain-containing protein [Clostridiaceae bacterium]
MIKCNNCGYNNEGVSSTCRSCGSSLSNANHNSSETYRTNDKTGTYSLVFGILSLFCCAVVFGPLAIIKGNEAGDSKGNVGKILGIIGLVLWGLMFIGRFLLKIGS